MYTCIDQVQLLILDLENGKMVYALCGMITGYLHTDCIVLHNHSLHAQYIEPEHSRTLSHKSFCLDYNYYNNATWCQKSGCCGMASVKLRATASPFFLPTSR